MKKLATSRLAQRRELLNSFADAWQQRDVEKVITCMSADCLYEASVGPEPGATFIGIDEVRSGILKMFEHNKGSEAHISNLFIAGRYAAWEWTYVWRESDEAERSVRGCDVFEFNGIKIRRKSAFRRTQE